MIILRKKVESTSYGGRSYIQYTYYLINLDRTLQKDPDTYRASRIIIYTNGAIHYDILNVWFPKYRLNMAVYQDASWLEMLVLFGLTKADIIEKFEEADD